MKMRATGSRGRAAGVYDVVMLWADGAAIARGWRSWLFMLVAMLDKASHHRRQLHAPAARARSAHLTVVVGLLVTGAIRVRA